MRTFTILGDIKGRDYEDLVRLVGGHAATCQLVSHREPTAMTCREALAMLAKLDESTAEVSEWHGTRLSCGNTALLHSFQVNERSLRFLASHVDSLFSWCWPDEPEDLCFLASDGSPILISTAHERYARLVFADGMSLSDGLKSALEGAAEKKIQCGFVVILSPLPVGDKDGKGYIGIEGEGWPVDLSEMPTIEHGLAPENEFERCVGYWRGMMKLDGFVFARLLYLGEKPPCEGFRPIGFDCGFYSNEIDNLSLVLNELHQRTIPSLAEYKKLLNEYGLFETRETAMMFLRQVLSEPTLRNSYRGCLEDLSVVKVHCYLHR